MVRILHALVAVAAALSSAAALPTISLSTSSKPSPVPIVIWHGLGDRYDAPGLLSLKQDLEETPELEGVFVHIVRVGEDGAGDQRATFFGSANDHVAHVCAQLADLPQLVDPVLNPSGQFDALGFSQGGQLLRAVVERCGAVGRGVASPGATMRRLVTVGSQHVGISSLPPCPPDSGPLSPCKLMHLSLVRSGIYTPWAQHNIVPAQYFRDPKRIDEYLVANDFLRDINNEREGDEQVVEPGTEARVVGDEEGAEPRNATYRKNLAALDKLVLFRFSDDMTVVPPQSAHFTLPSPNDTSTCPLPPLPPVPGCYAHPLPWSGLPLYRDDWVGLRALDERGRVERRVCKGVHMEIGDECWDAIVSVFVGGPGEGRREREEQSEGDEVWHRESGRRAQPKLVLQL
ncbi:hypothetical protein JCM8208_002080 [Rhodotorula glutinis]